ncbi:extracellular solute-binding protein [Microbacterium esteraromaticum]|uniref:Extracellular solute-binding protein n=1 Tax=Microbacterium esteraromaticum TaxID=57043 RepID=A0A7D7WFR7_9MICO|nr:extracellular solute-binding protein [Microbacterium esteraromaticum]
MTKKGIRMRIAKWGALVGVAAVSSLALAGCSNADAEGGSGGGDVTLSFAQWWQPEANGQMEKLVDEFEEANPGIKIELQTGPYGDTKDQLVAGAASGTLPDLIGLDGNWVYDLTKQGVLADLGEVSGDPTSSTRSRAWRSTAARACSTSSTRPMSCSPTPTSSTPPASRCRRRGTSSPRLHAPSRRATPTCRRSRCRSRWSRRSASRTTSCRGTGRLRARSATVTERTSKTTTSQSCSTTSPG